MIIKIYIVFCLLWTVYATIQYIRLPEYDNRYLWKTIITNLAASPICVGYAIYKFVMAKYQERKKLQE